MKERACGSEPFYLASGYLVRHFVCGISSQFRHIPAVGSLPPSAEKAMRVSPALVASEGALARLLPGAYIASFAHYLRS